MSTLLRGTRNAFDAVGTRSDGWTRGVGGPPYRPVMGTPSDTRRRSPLHGTKLLASVCPSPVPVGVPARER